MLTPRDLLLTRLTTLMDLRAAIRFPASCQVVLATDGLESRGSLLNISVWGCAVRGLVDVHRGDRCGLCLLMPNGDGPLLIDLARVRWSTGKESGIEFLNMTTPTRSRLRRFLLTLRTASLC